MPVYQVLSLVFAITLHLDILVSQLSFCINYVCISGSSAGECKEYAPAGI
jgi:hypothetical protein